MRREDEGDRVSRCQGDRSDVSPDTPTPCHLDTLIPQPTAGAGITRFATRGGQRLSYESSGARDGIAVLGLHDLLADRGQLRPLGEALPEAAFRLTLPDARGHGASPSLSARAYPAAELAADTLAILDAEGVARTHVAAAGWGAAAALSLATNVPDRVVSLVLAEPYLPGLVANGAGAEARQVAREHLETIREAAAAADKGLTDRALDLLMHERLGAGWRERLPKARLGAMRRAAANLAPLLAAIAGDPSDGAALRRLDIPATVLVSEEPPALSRMCAQALLRLLPHARVETIPRAPSGPTEATPDWIAAIARVLNPLAPRHDTNPR